MYARLLTFTEVNDVDAGVAYLQVKLLALLRQQHGYRGISASVDRSGAALVYLSLWDTESDREASDGVLAKARDDLHRRLGGQVRVDYYEQVTEAITKPPAPGHWLNLVRFQLDPATVDVNLVFFNAELLPQIASQPGFCALRNLVDRASGRGAVSSVWEDRTTMEDALTSLPGRLDWVRARGIVIGEVLQRQIVVADIN